MTTADQFVVELQRLIDKGVKILNDRGVGTPHEPTIEDIIDRITAVPTDFVYRVVNERVEVEGRSVSHYFDEVLDEEALQSVTISYPHTDKFFESVEVFRFATGESVKATIIDNVQADFAFIKTKSQTTIKRGE